MYIICTSSFFDCTQYAHSQILLKRFLLKDSWIPFTDLSFRRFQRYFPACTGYNVFLALTLLIGQISPPGKKVTTIYQKRRTVMKKIFTLSTYLFTIFMITACPELPNNEPIADAGNDQTVATDETVTLDGSGSSDPDGDTLSYQWMQTAGTDVELDDDEAAVTSFTAPDVEDTLVFELTVDDGQTGTSTDSVTITVAEALPEIEPVLFVANYNGDSIISFENPQSINGNIPPDTVLAGGQTQLSQPSDIVVTTEEVLIVSNFATDAITSYEDALSINGNFVPSGNVQGNATQIDQPTTLAINSAEDLLFVANVGAVDSILVFSNASSSLFNGNLAPTRIIVSNILNNPTGINLDGNDNLYVANNGDNNVLVFANASNLNGTVEPQRTIISNFFVNVFDVCICNMDNLYVVDAIDNNIYIYNNASSLNGVVDPDFILDVQGAASLTAIAVDSDGTGYIVDSGNDAIFSYNNIATLNGTLPPDRIIQGASTQLNDPIRVFLVE